MEINGEPVRLVEKFENLRTGMPVYVLCDWAECSKAHHRGILSDLKAIPHIVFNDGSHMFNVPGRLLLPTAHAPYLPLALTSPSVEGKKVYEIIDEVFEAELKAQAVTNPKQKAKVVSHVK